MLRLIKSFVRKGLSYTPYEVRRRPRFPERLLPKPTLENIQLLLAIYCQTRPMARFVQIGACDGVSGDVVHGFIKNSSLRALVVEPVPQTFEKLRKTYENVSTVTAAQVAIGTTDGSVTMFKVKDGAHSIDPNWSHQLASFNREHLLLHGVPEDEIQPITVPSLTLRSLLARFNFDGVDVLQVDTEGFDAEVVRMALELVEPPECINFENLHLTAGAKAELFPLLESKGYLWTHDRWNTLAVQEKILKEWMSAAAMNEWDPQKGSV